MGCFLSFLEPTRTNKMHGPRDDPTVSRHDTAAGRPPDDIDVRIADLADKHAHFSQYIDRHWHDVGVRQLARALSVHASNAVRLARLLRDRRVIATHGPAPVQVDPLIADLNDKLDQLDRYIDSHWPDPGTEEWRTLVALSSLNAIRLGQLMLHRRALRDAPLDDLERAINAARDLLAQKWDIGL